MPTAPQRAVNFLYATYRIKIRKRGIDTRYSVQQEARHKNTRLGVYKGKDIVKNAQKSL